VAPPIAAGKIMVGVSVTEPDTGSDVASLSCRAEPAERDGKKGWVVNGAKAWCTFAGRANVLALLARTDPNPEARRQGPLDLHRAEGRVPGHAFEMRSRAAAC
jgi:(2S)-methylsuccinyl-CoA dehydrogenase